MPIWLDPVISRVFHCFNELDNSSVHGVVTLSQIERNSPINVNVVAWNFNDLACCSIAKLG
jgi:hypothetical protein